MASQPSPSITHVTDVFVLVINTLNRLLAKALDLDILHAVSRRQGSQNCDPTRGILQFDNPTTSCRFKFHHEFQSSRIDVEL
jgi:hypothetical protein